MTSVKKLFGSISVSHVCMKGMKAVANSYWGMPIRLVTAASQHYAGPVSC